VVQVEDLVVVLEVVWVVALVEVQGAAAALEVVLEVDLEVDSVVVRVVDLVEA
jgi:hypothetical protein